MTTRFTTVCEDEMDDDFLIVYPIAPLFARMQMLAAAPAMRCVPVPNEVVDVQRAARGLLARRHAQRLREGMWRVRWLAISNRLERFVMLERLMQLCTSRRRSRAILQDRKEKQAAT